VAAQEVTVRLSAGAAVAEIVLGVRLAADGEHVLVSVSPRPVRAGAGRAAGAHALTRREREVLERLKLGEKNAEIARALEIGTETARTHAKHVYRKLGVTSRGELLGVEW
jgi:DNA-binding NarL/FixJ family response regulator